MKNILRNPLEVNNMYPPETETGKNKLPQMYLVERNARYSEVQHGRRKNSVVFVTTRSQI